MSSLTVVHFDVTALFLIDILMVNRHNLMVSNDSQQSFLISFDVKLMSNFDVSEIRTSIIFELFNFVY